MEEMSLQEFVSHWVIKHHWDAIELRADRGSGKTITEIMAIEVGVAKETYRCMMSELRKQLSEDLDAMSNP